MRKLNLLISFNIFIMFFGFPFYHNDLLMTLKSDIFNDEINQNTLDNNTTKYPIHYDTIRIKNKMENIQLLEDRYSKEKQIENKNRKKREQRILFLQYILFILALVYAIRFIINEKKDGKSKNQINPKLIINFFKTLKGSINRVNNRFTEPIEKRQNISEKTTIALPSIGSGYSIIYLENIIYCEADGSYTNYYTTDNKKFTSSNNLLKIEKLLSKAPFYRIHRSVLLNLKHIKKYDRSGQITLSNNKTLTVSERNKKGFYESLKMRSYTLD